VKKLVEMRQVSEAATKWRQVARLKDIAAYEPCVEGDVCTDIAK
jgi:hypothetical protein